jgi:hypothetical protein
MAYLRCTACGSKALIAASQCPRCAQPFNLVNARGDRVKLKQCRGCGIMHRMDASCHWCGEIKSTWRLSGNALKSAAAVALMLTGAAAAYRVAPTVAEYTTVLVNEARDDMRASSQSPARTQYADAQGIANNAAMVPVSAVNEAMAPQQDSANAVVATAGIDSITWTPAVARTWVNVRADASRGGEVVGVIKPTTRAMLGTDRAGWRLVKSTEVSGWVDPRLFEPDSLRTRGE